MKWGLIALNGTISSLEALLEQIHRIKGDVNFDYGIGVDGGCKMLEALDITPDLILGDFDSIDNLEHYKALWPTGLIKTFPTEKDYTDAELAFEEMLKLSMDKVIVIGGLGGRADHMLSIIHLMGRANHFIMVDELNIIENVKAPYLKRLNNELYKSMYVSLVPMQETFVGITLKGFKYPLVEATIAFSQTLGISNEIVDDEATIEIKKGSGYLIIARDRARLHL